MRRFDAIQCLVALLACGGLSACGSGAETLASSGDGGASTTSASTGGGAGDGGCGGEAGGGDGGGGGASECSHFVTGVVEHSFGAGQRFGQCHFPQLILGSPEGGGSDVGSLDVTSLGDGGFVTVEFAGNEIVDGPGPDFIVFENSFNIGGNPMAPYAELAAVAVSDDGLVWIEYPCSAAAYPYEGCAGWHPVQANSDNSIDPTDPAVAGGDAFDLADVGVEAARYVRVTDLAGDNRVFDLDAVVIVNAACP